MFFEPPLRDAVMSDDHELAQYLCSTYSQVDGRHMKSFSGNKLELVGLRAKGSGGIEGFKSKEEMEDADMIKAN
jgi:hypothetical protein